LRFVDVANARGVAEEADAFVVIRLALALEVGDHVVCDGFDIVRAEKGSGLLRHLVADFLPVHAMAFEGVVGATGEERHARAGPSAADGFHDLLAGQFGLAQ
jgi:hypothetical protein